MKINRMFEIVYLLMGRRKLTAQELAAHFEVSARTIYRDVESLMQAGIPLYTSRGAEGGIALIDGFVLDKAVLSKDEQSQVLLGLQSLPVQGEDADREALRKLGSLFNQPSADWIEVDFSRWGYKAKDDSRFATLRQALLSQQSIRFGYVGAKGDISEREAYPLKLVFKSKSWYLQAFCLLRDDYRTFKVNRMLDLSLGDGRFDRSLFSVPGLEEEGRAAYGLVTLELVFEPHAASRVFDEFDVDSIEVSDEGGIHVLTDYPDVEYLYAFLASFGDAVTVLQPAHVRERLAKRGTEAGQPRSGRGQA